MSITYLDVYDDALLKIGNDPLDSGDTTSDPYLWCTQLYPKAVKQVLADADWKCQKRRMLLEQDTMTVVFGYDYRYALPYDCIRVLSMYPDGYDHDIEGKYLLTDLDNTDLDPGLGVIYIAGLIAPDAPPDWVTATDYDVGDFVLESAKIYLCLEAHTSAALFATDLAAVKWEETSFRKLDDVDSLLLEAITCKLAYLLTYKIVQSMNWRGELIKEYEWIKLRAKQVNGMSGPVDDEGSTEWTDTGH
jgi:hypothetical protein